MVPTHVFSPTWNLPLGLFVSSGKDLARKGILLQNKKYFTRKGILLHKKKLHEKDFF